MKRIVNIVKRFLKPLFFIGVCVLVVVEMTRLSHEFSWDRLQTIIYDVGWLKLAIMAIVSALAVTPMLYYDFLFNRFLGSRYSWPYILERSITINSFNNLIGFGGLINIGLRMQYFTDHHEDNSLLKVIVKSFLFYFVGCSFLALVALIYLYVGHSWLIEVYWPWLIGGILYFPVVYGLSKWKQTEASHLPNWVILQLCLTSLLEWLGAFLAFLLIGFFLGVKLPAMTILVIFIVANLAGLASMIPGGIGSFDLFILTSFDLLGLDNELVLSWILLYRLFYYVVPFLMGVFFFAKNSGKLFDEQNEGIPSKILRSLGLDILAFLLYFIGVVLIFSATIPDKLSHIHWLSHFSQSDANIIYQFPSILLGYVFLVLGRAMRQKVVRAGKLTLVLLLVALVYAWLTQFGWMMLASLGLALALAWFSRQDLYRQQLIYSLEAWTIDGLLMTVVTFISAIVATRNYMVFHHLTRQQAFLPMEVSLWRISFYVVGIGVCLFGLIRYLKGPKHSLGEAIAETDIEQLIQTYPAPTTAGLVYLGDKEVFVWRQADGQIRAALQFFTCRDRVVVMGMPFGDPEAYPALTTAFLEQADLWGYSPVFYEVSLDYTMMLHDYGFEFSKFGETARVDLTAFSLEGRARKPLRNVMNKFANLGMSFEVIQPPYSQDLLQRLQDVSTIWLNGRNEKGFSLGFFDDAYLQKGPIALVRNKEGLIVAFANVMPVPNNASLTIDLMRFDPDLAPSGTMDYLFLQLFDYGRQQGKRQFDLGMAPLANVGINEHSFVHEKLAYLIYRLANKTYSFQGLRNYKQKFASEWEPVYTSYSRHSWLPYTIMTLYYIDALAYKRKKEHDYLAKGSLNR
ncbi:bifunctional lysylphosphatidylglycerol flippase/synthetase MprF [Vaginisenegalia massiliensis]|uniref:bifunctional lysylphosphatidylglycerol flippase/synthetase MprF n=1 Tax=Vaginisenegalia massiliensis TaxID=2058294 RepID=UPI000F5270DD|nr:bifunctional lysylphosphatidylglycerol flippase/synthetase MprF [Vaginisenegalia massiliensis]